MDGMGETYKAMLEDIGGAEVRTSTLMSTLDYCDCDCCEQQLPSTSPASLARLRVAVVTVIVIIITVYRAHYNVCLRNTPGTTCTT